MLTCWFGVDRSTITRVSARCGPSRAAGLHRAPDVQLRTLAEVISGTEIRVPRPAIGRKDRDKFVSGRTKQDAV
ncbi:hypothetical protein O3S80_27260 [Streptomyces sp. Lzd4kr]|nr:hypothetical protein [Streptomyces sp. Lzd4kr]